MDELAEARAFQALPHRTLEIRRFGGSSAFPPGLRDFPVDAIKPIRRKRGIVGNRRLAEYPARRNAPAIAPNRGFVPVMIDPDQPTCLPTRHAVRRVGR